MLFLTTFVAGLVVVFRGIYLGSRHIIDVRLFSDFNFTLCCLVIGISAATLWR